MRGLILGGQKVVPFNMLIFLVDIDDDVGITTGNQLCMQHTISQLLLRTDFVVEIGHISIGLVIQECPDRGFPSVNFIEILFRVRESNSG